METHAIYIGQADLARLTDMLRFRTAVSARDRALLETLQEELDRAQVVETSAMPSDVITMNSKVRLRDLETDEAKVYTLVFPSDANIAEDKVSVLAPIGTAILGYRVGDTVEWRVPAGTRRLRVEEILYQPEDENASASGRSR